MKITANYNRKQPVAGVEYASEGYHLTIESEPPPDIQQDREQLKAYVERLFAECRARVEDEFAKNAPAVARQPAQHSRPQARHRPLCGPTGRSNGNGHRRNDNGQSGGEYASGKQLAFLKRLAQDRKIGYGGLQQLVQDEFGMDDILHLSKRQASQLIDELRPDDRR